MCFLKSDYFSLNPKPDNRILVCVSLDAQQNPHVASLQWFEWPFWKWWTKEYYKLKAGSISYLSELSIQPTTIHLSVHLLYPHLSTVRVPVLHTLAITHLFLQIFALNKAFWSFCFFLVTLLPLTAFPFSHDRARDSYISRGRSCYQIQKDCPPTLKPK